MPIKAQSVLGVQFSGIRSIPILSPSLREHLLGTIPTTHFQRSFYLAALKRHTLDLPLANPILPSALCEQGYPVRLIQVKSHCVCVCG